MTKRFRLSALFSRLANRDGAAAVEFAILAPLLTFVLAGAIDFGGVVLVRFNLDNALSSAANYALNAKANVNGTAGDTLASTLGAILISGGATGGTVKVNSGPTLTITNGAASTPSDNTAANSCYCPSRSSDDTTGSDTITWGSAATCGSACAGGGKAGKFVEISASRAYTPLFSNYGFIDENQEISLLTVVQTE